jgi:eukaryotic-like serine/threonine-protein kinase
LFIALDAETGKEKYKIKHHGYLYSSPALAGNTAFYGDFTGKMYAVDIASGKVVNEFETDKRKAQAAQILDKEGTLNFQYLAKGKDPALYKTNVEVMDEIYKLGAIVSSPSIAGGVIYFGSADGCLYAINLENRDEAAKIDTEESQHH